MATFIEQNEQAYSLRIPAGQNVELEGDLIIPEGAGGLVLFAHGSGSSRFSPRNRFVAQQLRETGSLATLLMDLLTPQEEDADMASAGHLRFDIGLLAERLVIAARQMSTDPRTMNLPMGLFGASTGGGAALVAAAREPSLIHAVVSRGGRPDLAGNYLPRVQCPTLLIVGGEDDLVIRLNKDAMRKMHGEVRLEIIRRATHLFEEPGALEQVARLASDWFRGHLWPQDKVVMDGLNPA
jgi:dienelactone hydrolase